MKRACQAGRSPLAAAFCTFGAASYAVMFLAAVDALSGLNTISTGR